MSNSHLTKQKKRRFFPALALLISLGLIVLAYNLRSPVTWKEQVSFWLVSLIAFFFIFSFAILPAVYRMGGKKLRKEMDKIEEKVGLSDTRAGLETIVKTPLKYDEPITVESILHRSYERKKKNHEENYAS